MKCFDVIAYTADADTWCPECALKTYGARALGRCPECDSCWIDAAGICDCGHDASGDPVTDSEGNEVHPVFAQDDWQFEDSGLHCGACGEEIIPAPVPECEWCGEKLSREEDLREWPNGDKVCPECYRQERDSECVIQGSAWLAQRVLEWHGGQWSPTYAVGSSWLALREVPVALAWDAQRELSRVGAADVAQSLAELLEGSGFPEGGEPWA